MCQALGHPTFSRNPYNRYIKPYGIGLMSLSPKLYWNNGCLDLGTHGSTCITSSLLRLYHDSGPFNGGWPLTTGFFFDPFVLSPDLVHPADGIFGDKQSPRCYFFPHSNHYIGSFCNFVQIFVAVDHQIHCHNTSNPCLHPWHPDLTLHLYPYTSD